MQVPKISREWGVGELGVVYTQRLYRSDLELIPDGELSGAGEEMYRNLSEMALKPFPVETTDGSSSTESLFPTLTKRFLPQTLIIQNPKYFSYLKTNTPYD